MPNIVMGNPLSSSPILSPGVDYHYQYPDGLDFTPGKELHEFVKTEMLKRATEGYRRISGRYESWREIDRTMTTYITTDDAERKVKDKDKRKPVSIVFPYSYTIMETVLTYMTLAFLQDPVFRYEGNSPEDLLGAIMLEKVVQLQCNKSKIGLALHTMFRDSLMYGFGASTVRWEQNMGWRTMNDPTYGRRREEVVLYEGNKTYNIDPYYYIPDPNVSVDQPQRGEFVGFLERTNKTDLLTIEKTDQDMFNVKYLNNITPSRSQFGIESSARGDKTGLSRQFYYSQVMTPVDVLHMYIKIIPKDWKLGTSEYPEKWLFSLVNDSILIKARPADFDHNMFPVVVAAPDYDGYSPAPSSRIEMINGLQVIADWLINSHVANVRKAINDMLVVDPFLVNIEDLKDPEPGKLIRMRRPGWGKGVKDAVQQLGITDITRSNLQDLSFIQNAMQKVGAADESLMGALRSGGPERLTMGEFQGTKAGSVSRLGKLAHIVSMQAMQDLGYMIASHTQQLMSQQTYVDMSGRWMDALTQIFPNAKGRMKVNPEDILINYDITVRDGSIPGGNFSDAYIDMFKTISQNQALLQVFDIGKLGTFVFQQMGAKNVEEFLRQQTPSEQQQQMPQQQAQPQPQMDPRQLMQLIQQAQQSGQGVQAQVMPDEQVQQQLQAGNLVPAPMQ